MADSVPPQGEKTRPQRLKTGWGVFASSSKMTSFFPAPSGTYDVYRKISKHPTVALVMSIVMSPILGNTWNWTARDDKVDPKWVEAMQKSLDPMRTELVRGMLQALEFGWAPFEKVWAQKKVTLADGKEFPMFALEKLKALKWDWTEFRADEAGNITGLVNKVPGRDPVELDLNKCAFHVNDEEPGEPYGRARHENIRQVWNEAEQIREKIAQYIKKISGVIAQLHYPEGTSKDEGGADRANECLGQSTLDAVAQGQSVMFPNGFASADVMENPEVAYKLAGMSSWKLDFLNTGGTDYAPGMKDIVSYYDELLFQGWLRPARVGLEAKHGSRADVKQHSDTGTLDAEMIDQDIAGTINKQIVDPTLVYNFGESARGAVYITPAPISTDTMQTRFEILKAILANTVTGPQVLARFDIDGLCDDLDVPLKAENPEQQPGYDPAIAGVAGKTPSAPAVSNPSGTPSARDAQMSKMMKAAGHTPQEIQSRLSKK